MATVAEIIQQHRNDIIDRWAAEAQNAASARGLSGPELRDVMPAYLATLAGGEQSPERLREHLESHLASRIRQGFDLAEIVDEFAILERRVASVWEALPSDEQPSQHDRDRLSSSFQRTIVTVTELFQEHMQLDEQLEKRYLRLLQSLADEALRAPEAPLGARLKDVLDLILEAMDAQTAAILLYEPETERVIMEASAGAAEEELHEFATSIGPSSFTSMIAAEPEATSIIAAETTELTVSESLRHSGIHSLLGIRLPRRHRLLGVMYIGLREKRAFSAREVRRLEALGDQLTLHLDNAKLYAELREHIEDLGLERDLREHFVAILAHDLRGPLSAAKIGTRMLIRHPERLAERRDLAIRIERNLERIDRMISDLLDVSRVRAGQRLPLRLDWCDLGVVADEVVEELRATHGDWFELITDDAVQGIWSVEELRRSLWNLVVNAVKYGAPDKPITVRVERRPDGARVSVHNFGTPIPPEDQARLFDAFSRLRRAPRTGGGWGLGLTLVRACAEAHGGKVEVRSTSETGTRFVIDLPRDSRPYQQEARDESPAAHLGDGSHQAP